jgi:hypothetical protein
LALRAYDSRRLRCEPHPPVHHPAPLLTLVSQPLPACKLVLAKRTVVPFVWRLSPYSLLHAPEILDLLRRWTQRPERALILVREPLPAGERAGAERAFMPHAATAAGAFAPPQIADTAVLYGARPHNSSKFHCTRWWRLEMTAESTPTMRMLLSPLFAPVEGYRAPRCTGFPSLLEGETGQRRAALADPSATSLSWARFRRQAT